MELTNRLKRRFIKDSGLSIPLTDSPYFEYFIDLYDKAFHTKEKLSIFMKIVERFEEESEVLDYLQSITNRIIEDIQNKDVYKDFLTADMNQFAIKSRYPSSSIFKEVNTGKELISIDLSKANFQAMNYYNPMILQAENYKEFLQRYTNEEYIWNSKYIRQVIFGNLNSKRISAIEKYMIYQIVEKIESIKLEDKIISVTEDEIVLEGNKEIYSLLCKEVKNLKVDIELFILKILRKENGEPFKSNKFYVKDFLAHTDEKKLSFEIKATDSTFYSQFFKLLTNQKISENDLVFLNEGFVAQYKEMINGNIS